MSTKYLKYGVIQSLPICVSFSLIFFSLGALYKIVGLSATQSALSTIIVFAAPLQIASVQDLIVLNLVSITIAS